MAKLLRVGRRLAVLGVDIDRPTGPWHIVKPGSFTPALGADHGKTIGTSLCGRYAITNGYAADFTPPDGALCPACSERT